LHDEFDSGAGAVSFEELADHLLEQGLQSSPSAVHGCLCGLLSAGASHQEEYGLDALAGALDLAPHGELAGRVMQLYTATAAALQDETFDFHPLLPADDSAIADRVEALAEWCKGFLAGFAHARGGAPPALSDDSSEILEDFAAIAQAGLEERDEEEESESSYMELVEYLRFATLNLFMDNALPESGTAASPPPIH
jgi:yecA family protein